MRKYITILYIMAVAVVIITITVMGGRAGICRRRRRQWRLRCSELTNLREIGSGHAPIGELLTIIISVDLCETETSRLAHVEEKKNYHTPTPRPDKWCC